MPVIKDPEYALARIKPLVSRFEERMRNDLEEIQAKAHEVETIDIFEFYQRLMNVWTKFLEREQYWDATETEEEPIVTIMNK